MNLGLATTACTRAASSSITIENVSGSVGFPGVPYVAGTDNGGLPQMTFNDVATLGSPTYLPSNEIQNTYSVSDTFTLIAGNHYLEIWCRVSTGRVHNLPTGCAPRRAELRDTVHRQSCCPGHGWQWLCNALDGTAGGRRHQQPEQRRLQPHHLFHFRAGRLARHSPAHSEPWRTVRVLRPGVGAA